MDASYESRVAASVEYIRRRVLQMPKIGVVLGSGLGDFGNLLTKATSLQTKDIPHYPISSVVGHAGKILFGRIKEGNKESKELIVFQGRIHFYESDDTSIVVYPIEVAHRLGITKLIVTNAAGGVNRKLSPGDLMFITDYINFSFENPLIGRKSTDVLQTHPVFDPKFLSTAKTVALHNNIPFKEGVYCWTKGPSYESAAEITMMGKAGADAVGMSTVPEAILAASYGMEVLGISCVTNLATGLTGEKLAHAEVTEVANTVKHHFTDLVSKIILQL